MDSYKSGTYCKENYDKEYEYQYFLPSLINKKVEFDVTDLMSMLEQANLLLGQLNAYSRLIPDVDYFIAMHVNSEAVSSSRIEGTRTGFDEALMKEAEIEPERRDDWQEVQNYIRAMNHAIEHLESLPVSERLIKNTHKILLSGARGANKNPGKLKALQNWIGGSGPQSAHFVPPHPKEMPMLLSDWEEFWYNKSLNLPALIKVGMSHYQFETIHPFADGNGRIGRLIMTLQLIERGIITKPVLYISSYFEKYRQEYYDALDRVRAHDDILHWLKFFLQAVIESADGSKKVFEDIVELRQQYERRVSTLGRKVPRAQKLLLELFSDPILDVNTVSDILDVRYDAANALVANFVELGILEEITGYSRNRLFRMSDYVNLFRELP